MARVLVARIALGDDRVTLAGASVIVADGGHRATGGARARAGADAPPRPDPADVFAAHAPYVGRLALRLLGTRDEVEDIVQDVFLEALPRFGDLREPGAVRGWLAAITTRVVARRLRRRRVRRWLGLSPMPAVAPEPLVDGNAEPRLLVKRVYDVLDGVPTHQRIAWVLRYVEDLKLEEVAAASGCSVAAVKRRLAAVQERLDEVLGDG